MSEIEMIIQIKVIIGSDGVGLKYRHPLGDSSI